MSNKCVFLHSIKVEVRCVLSRYAHGETSCCTNLAVIGHNMFKASLRSHIPEMSFVVQTLPALMQHTYTRRIIIIILVRS
jgi:hypothetical protein